MTEKFINIDINNLKVRKILNAAFEEFAKFGLDKASLNKILKSAGISKGVFYHYFDDKEELFNFLIYFTVEISMKDLDKRIDWEDDDLIKRICTVSKLKLGIIKEYPFLIAFGEQFNELILNTANREFIDEWKEKFYTHNINLDKFKDSNNIKKVIHMVRWTFKGLLFDLLKEKENLLDEAMLTKLIKECDHYYEVLVSNLYK